MECWASWYDNIMEEKQRGNATDEEQELTSDHAVSVSSCSPNFVVSRC